MDGRRPASAGAQNPAYRPTRPPPTVLTCTSVIPAASRGTLGARARHTECSPRGEIAGSGLPQFPPDLDGVGGYKAVRIPAVSAHEFETGPVPPPMEDVDRILRERGAQRSCLGGGAPAWGTLVGAGHALSRRSVARETCCCPA